MNNFKVGGPVTPNSSISKNEEHNPELRNTIALQDLPDSIRYGEPIKHIHRDPINIPNIPEYLAAYDKRAIDILRDLHSELYKKDIDVFKKLVQLIVELTQKDFMVTTDCKRLYLDNEIISEVTND